MEFSIKSGSPEKQRVDCVIVGVFEARRLTLAGEQLDRAAKGSLSEILKKGDMDGRRGSTLLLHGIAGIMADRVLLVGLGKEKEYRDAAYREATRAAWKAVMDTASHDVVSFLTELPPKKRDQFWAVEQAASLVFEVFYRCDELKSKTDEPRRLKKITFNLGRRNDLPQGEAALARGLALGRAMDTCRRLGNLPPNVCTPTYLADQAREMAGRLGLEVEVLDQEQMQALGMGSLLSVARGSVQPPQFIILHHRGAERKARPIVLVGKGITFDSGGISLKPGEGMDEMKYDMCGAASVLATMQAVAELKLPVNLTVVVPTCENMPAGNANKPGDIVTSMSGQTIEVLNTDAEGRLILCDALTYVERFEPEVVIDVATLTGACVIALGHVTSGLFSNHDGLARELLEAADVSGDKAWHMPLFDEYQEQLKSNFADMANIGGRPAGSVTAACFLSRFTKAYDWAHLDIAGTAWKSGPTKGATGRPVPLLLQFVSHRSQAGQADRRSTASSSDDED